ncbi:GH92 family glycosyl hydrolase [Prolixibacter sp. NT017]|uniref:GH92 family glycosyl hydrolase n=1 Tax=Prolixibacter sp. NT017 TaxID=2652390 RepID=UPI00126E4281|nr:GH92 family glycosyl hydrolase [Prolixibacter sp. NT017]GET24010.1 hypothetical protein NT017_03390 [Prolixibacter sp. NT017]
MIKQIVTVLVGLMLAGSLQAQKKLTQYVNPFLGTAPLTNTQDIGYHPPEGWRVWAGLVFPGASVPNAMVQLSPVTKFHTGAGYQYEDTIIQAFTHTCKGHWNLCNIPVLPVSGKISADNFGSVFSHDDESAHPGYYQVNLKRYGINAELTSTLHCGFHRYSYPKGDNKKLVVNLPVSNERVRDWGIKQEGAHAFSGYQETGSRIYFYAQTNIEIQRIEELKQSGKDLPVVSFKQDTAALEMKIGLSFVSVANARENLEAELGNKSFEEVKDEAADEWENLLSKVVVSGGTEEQKELFYSSLYRSFLWPALRSDVNGQFMDEGGKVVKKNFRYYTLPSLWDTYRNKLVLLGWLSPGVTGDVIQSLVDRGEVTGFIPTFFHGDHAAAFIAGSYLRGIHNFDTKEAYRLLLRNATVAGGTRPYLAEYIEKGYISTPEVKNPNVETKAKAAVTKTLEYAYDDYAVALLAKVFHDQKNYQALMKRSENYRHLFDPSSGLMRGRLANGKWVTPFNPEYPYYEYMYREANAWQSSFFVPQNPRGLIDLYPSKKAFEEKLDSLFTIPWNSKYIARNVSSFIGQYCHGNQPDHNYPYLYYFIGKQPKSQAVIDSIMNHFYGMGKDGLALCGMDDAGEMSSWYVFNAIGLYPYSPADPNYIVTVPVFDKVEIRLDDQSTFTIERKGVGKRIRSITYDQQPLDGWFISHKKLKEGGRIIITTE